MTKNEYNGWTNYETWAVNLWLTNDSATQAEWVASAGVCLAVAAETQDETFSVEERATGEMATQLEAWHDDQLPELDGFAGDLLKAAMSEVNWHEIATHLIAEAKNNLARD